MAMSDDFLIETRFTLEARPLFVVGLARPEVHEGFPAPSSGRAAQLGAGARTRFLEAVPDDARCLGLALGWGVEEGESGA